MITILHHLNNETRKLTSEELPRVSQSKQGLIWLDLENPDSNEAQAVLDLTKISPVLLAEIRNGQSSANSPRLETFSDYLFIIFNMIELAHSAKDKSDPEELEYKTSPLHAFLFDHILVTIHHDQINVVKQTMDECLKDKQYMKKGTHNLLCIVLDNIVNSYLPVISQIDRLSEIYEGEIFHDPGKKWMEKVLRFKKVILDIRRISNHEREMMYRLSHSKFALVKEEEKPYFENVFNHLVRLADAMDSFRDAVTGLLDAYLSINSQSLNEVMKMLTIMSTIFLPLSVITGFYGMNLSSLPGASSPNSYIPVSVFMASVVGIMLYVFKKRKWL